MFPMHRQYDDPMIAQSFDSRGSTLKCYGQVASRQADKGLEMSIKQRKPQNF
jgi:hypothetical protein